MINKIANFFTSLKLTVACLSLAMVLVFVGTLAQVKLGLWTAQEEYFQSLFVYWSPGDTGLRIPVFPGGYLLGGILLINLIAAHCKRFELSRKKIGIFLVHAGLILLLLGQFFTELFTVESNLRLTPGETKNYSEATRATELALIDKSDPQQDKVYSIPDSRLRNETLIREDGLPFQVQVKNYWPNADLAREPLQASLPPQATEGFGRNLHVVPLPKVSSMD
ncbi:MAG TPA: ResB protein required for cytochrome C biosynthesis, partial [Methylomirabilota bacterium]|nr:ResB protein required for cytochrome C biosynthesis [Methylomirabilota bacterium]